MSIDEYNKKDIKDFEDIKIFIESIESQNREMVLSSKDKTVGAVLTAEQYEWFLNQLDDHQNIDAIANRVKDMEGSKNLDEFKKELDE